LAVAVNAGTIESRNGSAKAAPIPRKNVRRGEIFEININRLQARTAAMAEGRGSSQRHVLAGRRGRCCSPPGLRFHLKRDALDNPITNDEKR
jgi:hypothetical protein